MDPRDLPELKRDVVQSMYDHGPKLMTIMPGDNGRSVAKLQQSIPPSRDTAEEILFGCQLWSLDDTSTFYVTREMTEKALVASETMPDWIPDEEDAPADRGLIYFDGLEELRGFSKTTAALSWSFQRTTLAGEESLMLLLGVYSDLHVAPEKPFKSNMIAGLRSIGIMPPRLAYTGYDAVAGLFGEEDKVQTMAILKSAWLMMQQEEVVDTSETEPSRSSAKRIRRQGGDPGKVRIVDIKRRQYASQGREQYAREYDHRWKVRGHWRNQWYPSRGVHRPKWIEEHVRGPEDAPLIERDTVYRLK